MSYIDKYSDQVDIFIGVCHHLASRQYVASHGVNIAWKLKEDVILITLTKHNKGDVNRDNVVFINQAGETIEGTIKPTGETPIYDFVFLPPRDIKWAQMCTGLLEKTALHVIHARTLGNNTKEIGYDDLRDMGNVSATRGLPLPGAPGMWISLEEVYYPDGPPQAQHCTK